VKSEGRAQEERANPDTMYSEIHQICHIQENYPKGWISREECPCCGGQRLVAAFEKLGMRHDRCIECDYVCVNPYPPEHVLEKLYAGNTYNRIREFYELPRVRESGAGSAFSAPLELLEELIVRGTRGQEEGAWLDVGGGLGVFANLVAQRAPRWSVSLNEMNPRSIELARELFGLDILPDDVATLAAAERKFDVISAIGVLEHVADPLGFIKSYSSLLKPSGILIILVPHFTTLNVHVSKASNSNVIPPYHLSLFGEANLRRLVEHAGFFCKLETLQAGEPSFSLLDHVEYWQHWDALLPDADNPDFRSIKIAEYPAEVATVLNKLTTVVDDTKDFFSRHDGQVHLALVAVRAE